MNPVSSSPQALYLEDLHVGQRFDSAQYQMEADRMKDFAAEFDPQPFHLDEAAAEHTILRGLAASGWHTAAATMRLLMSGGLPIAGGLIGLSAEMAWPNPARPGDTLRVESEILQIVPSRSKPDRAVITVRCVTLNQKGQQVQIMTTKIMVFRRPNPTPSA